MAEREAVHQYMETFIDARRHEFVYANQEAALAEVERQDRVREAESKYTYPFRRTLNRRSRVAAGFTDAEIQQVIDWGFAPPYEE